MIPLWNVEELEAVLPDDCRVERKSARIDVRRGRVTTRIMDNPTGGDGVLASRHVAFVYGGLMRDTEENRWLLLDMARAMGGYGYDEMWWADVYEPDDLEYSAPTLYEAFVHSDDYDPGAHWVRRKEYGDGFESVTEESLLADAWHMRDDIVELARRGDVRESLPDMDFDARLARLETGA